MSATPLQTLLGLGLIGPGPRSVLEGALAFVAALFAIALRRRKRLFTPAGFIMLSLGWILDLVTPSLTPPGLIARYGQALAVTLFSFGVIRLAVEGVEIMTRGGRVQISHVVAEVARVVLYGAALLVVLRVMLGVYFTVLLSVPAGVTLVVGWVLQANFFRGLLLQSQRPFKPGDWVRFGSHLGQVQGTGWRATRVVTRANESVEIPNNLLSKEVLTNYTTAGAVADEIFIGIGYAEPPDKVEVAIQRLLSDIPEVLRNPRPEVDPWEYGDSAIRYRIRFWLSDYAGQEKVRTRIIRNLWYALRRSAVDIPITTRTIIAQETRSADRPESEQRMIAELRRVDFLEALNDEELKLLLPTIRVHQFGRGEVLMREGEIGNCFYILRRGKVEVLAKELDGSMQKHIRYIDDQSAENFVGEIALLTGEPRTATIRAVSDVEVLEINREGFTRLFKARRETAAAIADIVSLRMTETRERVAAGSARSPVPGRGRGVLAKMRRIFDF